MIVAASALPRSVAAARATVAAASTCPAPLQVQLRLLLRPLRSRGAAAATLAHPRLYHYHHHHNSHGVGRYDGYNHYNNSSYNSRDGSRIDYYRTDPSQQQEQHEHYYDYYYYQHYHHHPEVPQSTLTTRGKLGLVFFFAVGVAGAELYHRKSSIEAQPAESSDSTTVNFSNARVIIAAAKTASDPASEPPSATPAPTTATAATTTTETAPATPSDTADMRVRMEALVRSLQAEIVDALQAVEDSEPAAGGGDGAPARSPAKFRRDAWERPDGDGAGLSCILQDGRVFEKAAVLVSVVRGAPASEALLRQMRARALKGDAQLDPAKPYRLFVAGISLVVHPHNPNAPTAHLNYRYFELREDGKDEPAAWWFGGGSDLTPSYIFEEDAAHFHSVIKAACDKHDRSYYPRFKTWCDTYFHLPHRDEHRGVGGIFFDDLDERPAPELARFVEDCGRAFVAQYVPVVARRKDAPFSPAMKTWQQIRRGRYAEFNLVYDRGTKFGLATPGARVESIMCSLPLTARWEYAHEPEEGSDEWKMVQVLKNPREWA